PDRPPQHRVIVSDVTTEKLGELLVDNPRGMLYYVDELTLWFGSHDAYSKGAGGRDRGYALQAYDGGPTDMDRIGRGTVSIPNFSYSLMGTTQPDKIKAMLSKMTDDGLMQRFCTIETPARSRPGLEDRVPDPATVAAYEDTIRGLWALKPAQGRTVVTFSPEADAIRREFFGWVNRVASTDGLPAMLRGHLSKWEGLWPRLCLVYHCYGATGASMWPTDVPISALTAGRVTSLMQRFLLPQALRFYTETVAAADPVYLIAKKVAGMILANGSMRITNRDLQRGVNAWRAAQDWQKTSVIGMLRESGWLTGTDTRRTTGADSGWSVSPKVHTLFAQRAAAERLRRAEGVETLRELRDAAAGR
ncbi:MAG TPA: DUF3987 domain-containing protein, partial [Gammaproteobacteria bacterium]|nr:DUF3987 domain-containing protein [Gammaproteobacteria bacterium]